MHVKDFLIGSFAIRQEEVDSVAGNSDLRIAWHTCVVVVKKCFPVASSISAR